MATNKTVETKASVKAFVAKIADSDRRKDFGTILDLITSKLKLEPRMWGPAIVGYGSYHYVYESGREGDAPLLGLASRAGRITFYVGAEFKDREVLLQKLGKFSSGKGCIHIKRLSDIDPAVLLRLIQNSVQNRKDSHKC
jgi:hypothetical protein